LKGVADHIAGSFRALLEKFSVVSGSTLADRAAFVMGLYDGMMNETRMAGQRLPSRGSVTKAAKKKKGEARSSTLHVHPYTLAVRLGKQIRLSVPVEEITAELEAVIQKHLGDKRAEPG
jgi:hypothetical protein